MILKGRVALVTGGARRVGHHLAIALAKRHAHLVITYRTSRREADHTVAMAQSYGATALAIRADVTKAREVRRVISHITRRFGKLHVLINNAAVFDRTPLATLTEAQWIDTWMPTSRALSYAHGLPAASSSSPAEEKSSTSPTGRASGPIATIFPIASRKRASSP